MNLISQWFKKAEPSQVQSQTLNPNDLPQPRDAVGYLNRGMVFFARRQYEQAIQDLFQSIQLDANLVDAHYCLGMTYKASQKNTEAVQSFRQTITLLEMQDALRPESKTMLRRLALGHIHEIETGNWDLEKEIWRHIP